MKNEPTINGLLKKRAELAGQVEHHQGQVAKLMADIAAVEASIRLFDPDIKLDAIVPKPIPVLYPAMRGEITALALRYLREAAKPMTAQELNERVMAARNIPTADDLTTKRMYWRLQSTLRNHRKQGRLRSIKGPKGTVLWEVSRNDG